jgi:hypothetical protein
MVYFNIRILAFYLWFSYCNIFFYNEILHKNVGNLKSTV